MRKTLAAICNQLAEATSDETGFVSIRELSRQSGVRLEFRPLLVEGMLVRKGSAEDGEWLALIDDEGVPLAADLLQKECVGSTLPARLRFTASHEIVHSLALRASEFGFVMPDGSDPSRAPENLIEKEVDMCTPLCLMPQRHLYRVISSWKTTSLVEELSSLRKRWGVSRAVIVSRLAAIRHFAPLDLHEKPALRDIAVGIISVEGSTASLREWPIFQNFHQAVPFFLSLQQRKVRDSVRLHFCDKRFVLNGGSSLSTDAFVSAGTTANPEAESLHVSLEVEPKSSVNQSEFLFTTRIFG